MQKNIFIILLIMCSFFMVAGCGEIEEIPVTPDIDLGDDSGEDNPGEDNPGEDNPGEDNPGEDNPGENNPGEDNPGEVTGPVEFVVSLVYNDKVYKPGEEEVITVIWADDYSQYTEVLGSDGFARKELDGDFVVYVDGITGDYTYNPNIYTANNESPIVEIELLKISKVSKGKGTKLYNEYKLSNTGTYRATVKNKTSKVYYEYEPKEPGYYVIESIVNIYDDLINPKIDIYTGTFAVKYFSETLDDGGKYLKGGYTKNFKWVVKLSVDELQNVFTFAIFGETKTGVYPITIDFKISYEGEYYRDPTISNYMEAEEANFKTPEFSSTKYVYKNSDGGVGSYYNSKTNGTGLLTSKMYKYNPDTGYYHVFNSSTGEFGPILCAKITSPCAYYEEALSRIESHGNKNLTVSNGTENYKQFIEISYAATCNSDGVCYVTQELKEFLQKFSVSQRLFFDGNGFVESTGVYAVEDDQWLFACGYYEEK